MQAGSWAVITSIILNGFLLTSSLFNFIKPKIVFTWILSLFASLYYAPLLLLCLCLNLLLLVFYFSWTLFFLSTAGLLPLSVVAYKKWQVRPQSKVDWRRLFLPKLVGKGPDQTLHFPITDGEPLKIDFYKAAQADQAPAVFFLFGGGFLNNDQSQLTLFLRRLSLMNVHVYSLGYRQLPHFNWPTPLNDILAMIRWTKENLPKTIEWKGYYLGGRSAGGCLALCASAQIKDEDLLGTFAIYPVTDLKDWSEDKYANSTLQSRKRISHLFADDQDLVDYASPVNLEYPKNHKYLLVSGDFDPLVDVSQSYRMMETFAKQNIPARFLVFPTDSHGFDANLDNISGQKLYQELFTFLTHDE